MNGTLGQNRRISLRDLLIVIFSKLYVCIGIFLTIVVVTMAVAFFTDPVYKVSANVLVKPALEPTLKLQAPTPTHLSANPVSIQDINSEVQILSSPQLLREVVRKLDLVKADAPRGYLSRFFSYLRGWVHQLLVELGLSEESDPEDQAVVYLHEKLQIKPIALSNMVEISLSGESPGRIAKVVNTLLGDYIEYHVDLFRAKGAREFYAQQADLFSIGLKKAEDDLEKFKKDWSIIEIVAQNNTNIELLKILRENLAMAQAQISDRQIKLDEQQKNLTKTGNIGAFTKEFQSNILEELVRAMGPLMAERERIGILFESSSPKYQALNQQVGELKQAYNKQVREILNGNRLDLNGLVKYAWEIAQSIEDIEKQSLLLSTKQVEYDRLVREVKQQEENYILYLRKTEEARIQEQQDTSRVSNISVTQWAEVPSVPIFPKRFLMLVLSLIIGLLVGVSGASVAYYVDHAVKTPEDIIRNCQTHVLASIPFMADHREVAGRGVPAGSEAAGHGGRSQSNGAGVPLWMNTPKQYPQMLESYRALKTNLHLPGLSQESKVILFTGPHKHAGSSTAAFNLALLLSWDFIDQRILLVDTNLSDPALQKVFGRPVEPGLMNYLTEDRPFDGIVQTSFRPNLDFVTVGKGPTEVLSPFDLQRFSTFLIEARKHYTHIVVDSAPVLRSSDTLIISAKVDSVVLVVEANQTRYEVVNEIRNQLEGDARLAGTVINKRRFVIPRALYRRI